MSADRATRTWTLCADDYGASASINEGILELAAAGRLGAISCMTKAPHWRESATRLALLPPGVRLGLHLNLTDGPATSALLARRWPRLPRLSRLMLLAGLRALPLEGIRDELHAQLHAFRVATGRLPDYIDGHQHVHHLPGVRDLLIDLVTSLSPSPVVRDCARLAGPGSPFKRWVIRHSGAQVLHRSLHELDLAANAMLMGSYGFSPEEFRTCMRQWLAALPPSGGWIYCHPAKPGARADEDPIAGAREREYGYLRSPDFAADVAAAGLQFSPGSGAVRGATAAQDAAKVQRRLMA